MELKRKYKLEKSEAGMVTSLMSASKYGSPAVYLDKIRRDGEFAEHLFIQMAGAILGHDIIVLYLHKDTSPNKMYVRVPGGPFGTEETGDGSRTSIMTFIGFYCRNSVKL